MRRELDEKLCAKYPTLFRDMHGDMRTTAMCWGFECDDGWYNLLDECCDKLSRLQPPHVAVQVKEKYGTLRFYLQGYSDEADIILREAEDKSAVTCEVCGNPGKLYGRGWLKTLCAPCALKLDYQEFEAIDV